MAKASKIQIEPTDSTETAQQLKKKLAALVSSKRVLETNESQPINGPDILKGTKLDALLLPNKALETDESQPKHIPDILIGTKKLTASVSSNKALKTDESQPIHLPDILTAAIGTEKDHHARPEDHDERPCRHAPELVKQRDNGAVDRVKDKQGIDSFSRTKKHYSHVVGSPEESGGPTEKPDDARLRLKTQSPRRGLRKKKHGHSEFERILEYVSAVIRHIIIVSPDTSILTGCPVAAESVSSLNDDVEVDGSPEGSGSGGPTETPDDARFRSKTQTSHTLKAQSIRNTHSKRNLKYPSAPLTPLVLMITCISLSTAYPVAVGSGPAVSDAAIQPLQLTGGTSGSVTFTMTWPRHDASHPVPYYTIRFESEDQPFCTNDEIHTDGLKYKSQEGRFKATNKVVDQSISVNLKISDVCDEDKDVYVMTLILLDYQGHFNPVSKKQVDVYTPPGKAKCFITDNDYNHLHQVHCTAKAGSSNASSLCCFQNNDKIPYMGDIYNDRHHIRGVFWMRFNAPVYCCSHENKTSIDQASCMHYIWPPRTPSKVPQGVKVETTHSPSMASKPTPSPTGSGDLKNVQSLRGVLTVSFIVLIATVF